MRHTTPVAAVLAVIVACSAPVEHTDLSTVLEVPARYAETESDGVVLEGWCSDFQDPDLSHLIDLALAENFSLRAAWARVAQAEAMARQAGSALWPMLDAQLGASHSRSYAPPPLTPQEQSVFSASLPVAYEVDIWGRIAATAEAADFDAMATRTDYESMAITVAAQVAEAWFDVIHQRAKRELLETQIETNQTFLDLVYYRMGRGLASAPDVLLQQQQIEMLQAELVMIDALEATAAQRLAVLVGEVPQTIVGGERPDLPLLPEAPSVGVPVDLLQQRPDVRSAQFRLAAADYRLAAAIVDQLPSLRLSGTVGFQATDLVDLLEEVFWSVAGSISAPLFDGFRRSSEVDRSEAVVDERLFQYAQTLLTAMMEVESSLVMERQQLAFIDRVELQMETAESALEIERERYRRGVTDFLRVLTSLQSVQRIERSLLDSHRQLLSNRVQLCRAVGGEWTRELSVPTVEEGEP